MKTQTAKRSLRAKKSRESSRSVYEGKMQIDRKLSVAAYFLKVESDAQETERCCQEIFWHLAEVDQPRAEAHASLLMGQALHLQGKFRPARIYLLRAIHLGRRLSAETDLLDVMNRRIWLSLTAQAILFLGLVRAYGGESILLGLSHIDRAEAYFLRADDSIGVHVARQARLELFSVTPVLPIDC